MKTHRNLFQFSIYTLFIFITIVLFAIFSTHPSVAYAQEIQNTPIPNNATQEQIAEDQTLPETSCITCTANPNTVFIAGSTGIIEFDSLTQTIQNSGLIWPTSPRAGVVTPSGLLFIAGHGRLSSFNKIYGLDTSKYQITTSYPLRGNDQRSIVISKDGNRMYVSDNYYKTITVINIKTNKVIEIPLSAHPEQIALSPDDSKLYVSANTPSTFIIINTTNYTKKAFAIGSSLSGVYAAPNGKTVFISDRFKKTIYGFETTNFSKIATISLPVDVSWLNSNADGSKIYGFGYLNLNIITIDTRRYMVLKKLQMDVVPTAATMLKDKIHMYIVGNNYLGILDTTTDTIVQRKFFDAYFYTVIPMP